MKFDSEEDKLLRSVALQNARAVLLAREKAERELLQTKEMLERRTEELREQREWFAATLSSIGDGVIATDLAGKITFLNPVAEKMTGWNASEAAGQSLASVFYIVHGEENPAESPIENLLRGEASDGLLKQPTLIAKNGKRTPIEQSAAPIKDADGKISGAVMMFRDVSERRLQESRLRESEHKLRATFSQAAVGIAVAGMDRRLEQVNARFAQILGYSEDELKERTFESLVQPDELAKIQAAVQQLFAGEITEYSNENRYARKDGAAIWCLTTVTLLKDGSNCPKQFVWVIEDISVRKKTEDALREETRILELLNKTGSSIAGQLNLKTLVQTVTDAATEIAGAQFGAFFYNVINQQGESFLLYTLSGAPREAFEKFGMPRNTPIFSATFSGQGVVRSADITKDPRYGKMPPHHGMPKGHLPVRSYLAVPVVSRSREVIGGLFFGHQETGVFTERSERVIVGIAAQAAVAIDNARLYEQAREEIAVRKRAEEAVLETSERLQLAMSAGHLGDWKWSADTNIVTLSKDAANIFGLPNNDPVTWVQLRKQLHDDDRDKAESAFKQALALHSNYNMEYRAVHPTGDQYWVAMRGTGTYANDGSVTGMIGVIQDITQRKRAELERERLASILERSLNEVYIFDAEQFRFEYVNEGARRNLGYTLEAMRRMTPLDLKPEFTEATFRQMVAPLISGEKKKHVFYTVHRRHDGSVYPVEVHLQIVTHEGQRFFLAVILDITERKKMEEATVRLASVVESSDDAIISKTLDGILTTWNKGAERMYGYTADEVIGKPVTILIPAHLLDEEPLIVQRLKRGEKIEHYETTRMRKDGTLLDVALTVSPIKDSSGKIIGASKIARDITERKKAQLELQRAKDDLEQKVMERTASLRETTAQLEAFCYTVAHDLRSPLRAQQSFAQVLLEDYKDVLDETGRDYAKRIMKAARRLDQLVNDLLAYSRLSHSDLEFQKINLGRVVQDVQEQLAEDIQENRAVIVAAPLQGVLAYEPTLNLVITNLVANALKFMAPGVPPRIRIWSEPKGEVVRLWVEDNGIGIEPEHREKIFGVFERLHPTEKYSGTGIGLAIVEKGVARMGGRAGVESEVGKGSRFWIELPEG